MTGNSITPEEFSAGYRELVELFWAEYGQSLAYLVRDGELDDMGAWRVGRLAGVLLKQPFATQVPATNTFTGARYSYSLTRDQLSGQDFAESWQAAVYTFIGEQDAVESALWLDTERRTFRSLVEKTYRVICSNRETLKPWVDDAFTLSGAAFDASQSCTALANWLAHNVPGLDGGVSPTFLAVFVVLITRMGLRRFCSWAEALQRSSTAEIADSRETSTGAAPPNQGPQADG